MAQLLSRPATDHPLGTWRAQVSVGCFYLADTCEAAVRGATELALARRVETIEAEITQRQAYLAELKAAQAAYLAGP